MKPGLNLGGGRRLLQSSDYITRATGPEMQEVKKESGLVEEAEKIGESAGKGDKTFEEKR